MLDFQLVRTGVGEPVACARCAARELPAHDDTATVMARVREVLAIGADGFVPDAFLAGGEPLLRDDAVQLVESVARQGARRIAAFTDAAALCDSEFATATLRAGLQHLHVPLLGPDATLHDSLAGQSRFAHASEGMRAFKARAADAGIRTVLYGRIRPCVHNVETLPATVKTFAEHGADAVTLALGETFEIRHALPWIVAAFDTGLMNGVWVSIEGAPAGLLGAASAGVRAPVRIVGESA